MAKKSAFGRESEYHTFADEGKRIGDERDKSQFAVQLSLLSGNDLIDFQRAASVLHHVTNIAPDLFAGHEDILLEVLKNPLHDSGPRMVMRVLRAIPIPEAVAGTAIDLAFKYLNNPKTAVAIKANAMELIAKQIEIYPEFKHELELSISTQLAGQSPGFKSTVRNLKKKLNLDV